MSAPFLCVMADLCYTGVRELYINLCNGYGQEQKGDIIMTYQEVQNIAKQTITYIKQVIEPGMSLMEIRQRCEEKMLELGADSFWYWDIGAFCFAGEETTVSVSGTEYQTSDRIIRENEIITIDLSPQNNNIWGDYARTVIMENGQIVDCINDIHHTQWKQGLQMEEMLHSEMKRFVTENTTFEELYYHMNEFIVRNGYINLDFLGNLGHSIVQDKVDRIYIEKGNSARLSDVALFTFEPHISTPQLSFGYKKENIYYFEGGVLLEL